MSIGIQYAQVLSTHPKENWSTLLEKLEKITKAPLFIEKYKDPFTSNEIVFELINSCCKKTTQVQKNFIQILIRNKRLHKLSEIKEALKNIKLSKNNQQLIVVTTALSPTPATKKEIESYAKTLIKKEKKPVFEYYEQAHLIGGFTLSINGYIVDRSIKSRLKAIEYTEGE